MQAGAALALSAGPSVARRRPPPKPPKARAAPFPLSAVRLKPSVWLDAVEANRNYLLSLDPDRLLHGFRKHAGLKPKGEPYGGWESESLAGHTLGHYLSALALLFQQTGEEEAGRRAVYIVGELAECQRVRGDGYIGALTRRRGDTMEDGRLAFEDVRAGKIAASDFDLNGAWSPLYTVHKLLAGLLDAHAVWGDARALEICDRLGLYFEGVLAGLSDAQIQQVLDCEHGGIVESFAELHARTGNNHWLRLAERLYHRKVLDPLAGGRDELAGLHANTQVPKLIALARLYELTGKSDYAQAAGFFWEAVVRDHSYVIGGNSDRERFQRPRSTSAYITEQTCESCNTYNMLKLTRHLYAQRPDARYFDYYERAHLNHILAQHNPKTGMFAYMMPLMSGEARSFSSPVNDFWCCCGTGMESHSKHGDSVFWKLGDGLAVNLYIPSALDWTERGARVELETHYPFGETAALRFASLAESGEFTVALRIPAWCSGATLRLNGKPAAFELRNGYASLRRKWAEGDTMELTLPMMLRLEATPDDPDTIALLHGPMVLAADLGAAAEPFRGPDPALVASDVLKGFQPESEPGLYRSVGIGRPGDMTFSPFFRQYDRRSAVYLKRFTEAQWAEEQQRLAAEKARLAALDARSLDIVKLGDDADEKAHGLKAKISYPASYRRRTGRDARSEGYFEFRLRAGEGPLALQATYWGEERNKKFRILVDGHEIAREELKGAKPAQFFETEYPGAPELTRGKRTVTVRFEPVPGSRCGPVFGCRLLRGA